MIKYLIAIILTCFVYLCSCSRHSIGLAERTTSDNLYEVAEIKKVNSWYFIYFQRNDSIFKVVSYQPGYLGTLNGRYRQIEKGERYDLHLHSYRDAAKTGLDIWPGYITGYQLDSETTVSVEPEKGIHDLYRAEELAGLYYLKAINR